MKSYMGFLGNIYAPTTVRPFNVLFFTQDSYSKKCCLLAFITFQKVSETKYGLLRSLINLASNPPPHPHNFYYLFLCIIVGNYLCYCGTKFISKEKCFRRKEPVTEE